MAAISTDCATVFLGRRNKVEIWGRASGRRIREVTGQFGEVEDLVPASGAGLVAIAGEDGVRLVRSASGEFLGTYLKQAHEALLPPIRRILSAAGERLAVPLDEKADALEAEQAAQHRELGLAPEPCGAAQQLRRQAAEIRAVGNAGTERDALFHALEQAGASDL